MGKVLIIGAGGVGTVVAHKVAQNPGCVHRNHDCESHQIQM